MKIVIVDGQGGGLGRVIIEQLRARFSDQHEIIAVGTNAMATTNMLKGGADAGASGENAIVVNITQADLIAGAMGILLADGMMGEITPRIALAVARSRAHKLIIPFARCGVTVAGVPPQMARLALIQDGIEQIAQAWQCEQFS